MTSATAPITTATEESHAAVRNGIKLGLSLLATWGIALGIRLVMPRYLGPELFGELNWAEAFAATWFVLLSLGVDLYVRQRVAVDPSSANGFFGGIVVLRTVLSVLILAVVAGALHLSGRTGMWPMIFLFGGVQFFYQMNETFAALLHAHGKVNRLSIVNVATKLAWALGIVIALAVGLGLWTVVIAYLVAEVLKFGLLLRVVFRDTGLQLRVDVPATRAALWGSLPFFVNGAAVAAFARIDVALLGLNATEIEVGWYGAAAALSGVAMLLTPAILSVLIPTLSRARARSTEEFTQMLRRSFELILSIALPVSLAMGVGADLWTRGLFGEAFAPAALPLQILSVRFALTYVAIVCAVCLQTSDRSWTVTFTSVASLVVGTVLNVLLVPVAREHFAGTLGGAGAGSAAAQLITELLVAAILIGAVGRQLFDAQNLSRIARNAAVCAAVIVLHVYLAPLGHWRVAVDAFAYLALALPTRALPLQEIVAFVRASRRPRETEAGVALSADL